jgi:primosomal protein N' (replication factor Y)
VRTLFDTPADRTRQGKYARVAVERAIERMGDGSAALTYACGGFSPALGERVEVPLGRQKVPGVVVQLGGPELAAGVPEGKIRAISGVLGVVIPTPVLRLGEWISEYYLSPLGVTIGAMLPAAVKVSTGTRRLKMVRLGVLPDGQPPTSTPPLPPVPPLPPLPAAALRLLETARTIPAHEFPMDLPAFKRRMKAMGAKGLGPATLGALEKAGALSITDETHIRAGVMPGATQDAPATPALPPTPTAEQARAIEGIGTTLGAFGVHLLHGVTGSGKTEVYLRLMERVLEAGDGAIVLVPEIALTPQTSERFITRLGAARVAVMHSGLTAAQRHREWSRAAAGEARVVVGARSAVFAPVHNLGLIVVDEEHDTSYKQDRSPRYHARDVAVKRAHLEGACVVLGSATPSLESWANAAKGRFTLWSLPTRAGGATLPRVEIVDMGLERKRRYERGKDSTQHLLGPTLEDALGRTLAAGAQAILLLNRRGFSSYIACVSPSCGYIVSCADCDAHLVLHRDRRLPVGTEVRCHHCEARQKVPAACPACASRLNFFSGGTQRLEQELARKFAPMGLVEGETFRRVDSDTMRSARDYFEVLGDFARGALRVLIGTQMLAKGLDFPGVRLVGVIDADTALHIPDFRSAERTFQLVSQVAGRAGRGTQPGLVLVQTMSPQNPAIVLASQHRYTEFAKTELAIRVRSGLPPATRMARIVCKHESEAKARRQAEDVAGALRTEASRVKASLRGPDPCPLSRIAGEYRFAVEVIATDATALSGVLRSLRGSGVTFSDTGAAVDVDPVALL